MADGKLNTDPLFIGLTRPPLLFGVSYMYFILNIFFCAIFFIQTSNFWFLPLGLFIHLMGFILCNKEPLVMELLMIKMQKCNNCSNKLYHGANSYDPF